MVSKINVLCIVCTQLSAHKCVGLQSAMLGTYTHYYLDNKDL